MPNFGKPIFDIPGIQKLLAALDPGDAPSGSRWFPDREGWKRDSKRHSGGCNSAWLSSILKDVEASRSAADRELGDVIDACRITDGLAVFASLCWNEDVVTSCSVQVLVTENGSLEELLGNPAIKSQYYRLDYSDVERGRYFDHPYPHVHSSPKGHPRFPWNPRKDEFFILSFIEFVVVNHLTELWLDWLYELAWNSAGWWNFDIDLDPIEFLERYKLGTPLELIPQATSRFELLERLAAKERQASAPQRRLRVGAGPNSMGFWVGSQPPHAAASSDSA